MKIYSKFHDYYDSAMGYGVDDHIHWNRNATKIADDVYPNVPNIGSLYPFDIKAEIHIIKFCGKMYPVVEIYKTINNQIKSHGYAYNSTDILNILNKIVKKNEVEKVFPKTKTREHWILGRYLHFSQRDIDTFFKEYTRKSIGLELFFEYKTPIIITRRERGYGTDKEHGMFINCELKPYSFQKIIDPFTAYQEIEMFMGGVLGLNDPETVNIEDKYLSKQKGFNEWSFKKLPTKRKK